MKTKILLFLLILTSGIYATKIVKSKTTIFYRYGNVYGMQLFNNTLSALTSGNFSAGNFFNGAVTRGYSDFNLTEIPTSATIKDAKLHLVCYGSSTSININKVTGGWQTSFANLAGWNSLNYSTLKSSVINGNGTTTNTIDLSSSDLIAYVNLQKNKAIGFGFVVSNETTTHIKLLEESTNHSLTVSYEYSITAPDIPNLLAVSNGSITSTGCTLTWSELSGVSDYYNIYIYDAAGTLIKKIEKVNVKTYAVTGLTPATNYSFKVSAFDSEAGETAQSIGVTCLTIPLAPENLSASASCSSVSLSWLASDGQVSEYKIYQDNVLLYSTTNLSIMINNLTTNTPYTFSVCSNNQTGNSGMTSKTITTLTTPVAPLSVSFLDLISPTGVYTLYWRSVSTAVGYKIYRVSPVFELIGTTTTMCYYTLGLASSLPTGTNIYGVSAYNAGGCESNMLYTGFNIPETLFKNRSYISNEDKIEISPSKITVYPNPVINKLYIDGTSKVFEIDITNLQGQVVKSESNLTDFIDLTELKSGIYIVKIKYDGVEIIRRIIKK